MGGISCELQKVSKLTDSEATSWYHREWYDVGKTHTFGVTVKCGKSMGVKEQHIGSVSSFYRGHSFFPFQDIDDSIILLYE